MLPKSHLLQQQSPFLQFHVRPPSHPPPLPSPFFHRHLLSSDVEQFYLILLGRHLPYFLILILYTYILCYICLIFLSLSYILIFLVSFVLFSYPYLVFLYSLFHLPYFSILILYSFIPYFICQIFLSLYPDFPILMPYPYFHSCLCSLSPPLRPLLSSPPPHPPPTLLSYVIMIFPTYCHPNCAVTLHSTLFVSQSDTLA